jgi:hypothetical protein
VIGEAPSLDAFRELKSAQQTENCARGIDDDREDAFARHLDGLLDDVRAKRFRLGRSRLMSSTNT